MIEVLALLAITTVQADPDRIQAEVAAALRDADSRSSLLLAPGNAGHDGGFFIEDDRGNFKLKINGQIQTRFLASWRDGGAGTDSFSSGFQTRRLKLTLSGHVIDDSIQFKITNEAKRLGGGAGLSDAYLEKRFGNGVTIRAGQFKLPFTREYLDSSRRQLAVDRSLVNAFFGLNRSQGVQISYQDDRWRLWGAFSDGRGSLNIDFGSDATNWSVTGRTEWLSFGTFDVFKTQAGSVDAEPSLRLGGAIHAEERSASILGPGGRLLSWTGDITAGGPGWIGYAAVVGRENDQSTGVDRTDWGITTQLGIWATEQIQPFVRWELLIPDSDRTARSKTNILTAGTNWYIHGNALKLTVDGVWLIDGAGSNDLVGPGTGIGILPLGIGDTQFVLRAQVQLLF